MTNVLRIGIVGLGTVGQALIRRIESQCYRTSLRIIQVVAVSALNRNKLREIDISSYRWFDNPYQMALDSNIDIIVEVAGGLKMPQRLAEVVINARKSWITANKALLAEQGLKLYSMAKSLGVSIGFEAAICGAIPIVKIVREALAGDQLYSIQGIMNGTCNYIFTRMAAGDNFNAALIDAQQQGFAETNPTLDIEGIDAAHKIALLTTLYTGIPVKFTDVLIEGITSLPSQANSILKSRGYALKLISQAVLGSYGWQVMVTPRALPIHHPLALVNGVTNAVLLRTRSSGDVLTVGVGAGGDATATAIMADIIDIAENRSTIAGGLPACKQSLELCPLSDIEDDYLIYSPCNKHITKIFPTAIAIKKDIYALFNQKHKDVSNYLINSECKSDNKFYLRLSRI